MEKFLKILFYLFLAIFIIGLINLFSALIFQVDFCLFTMTSFDWFISTGHKWLIYVIIFWWILSLVMAIVLRPDEWA